MSPCPAPLSPASRLAPLAVATLVSLAGCGGGGSDSTTTTPTTPPTPSPAPAPAPGPAPAPAPGPAPAPAPTPAPAPPSAGTRITCNLASFQADMLAAVNAHRRAGATCGARGAFAPTTELTWNAALTQAAVVHSDDMVANNFFSHTGSNGSTLGTRATAAGYVWSSLGENIAAGQATVAIVVDGWMKSDGHCANLMSPGFREIGAACVAGNANTTYRTYWTQDFGSGR